MGFMSRKQRSKEEISEILKAYAGGSSVFEIRDRFGISLSAFHRLLRASRGMEPDTTKANQKAKVARLERELAAREKEIRLLKEALKKS